VIETGELTKTDIEGRVVIDFKIAGIYRVRFTKPGYEEFIYVNLELSVGDKLNLEVQLTAIVA